MTLQERQTIRQYFETVEDHFLTLANVLKECSNQRLETEYRSKAALMPKLWLGLWKQTEITEEE